SPAWRWLDRRGAVKAAPWPPTDLPFQLEGVRIPPGREALAKAVELFRIQADLEHAVPVTRVQQAVTEEVQHLTVAAVGVAMAIGADPVHPGHVAEVLDGPRGQQAAPGIAPGRRPVGGVEQQVGALRVATPYREAQVVADQRAHPPALELEQRLLVACGEMLVLAGHAEQVTLVVVTHLTVRLRPEQAVAIAAIRGLDDQRAGDHCLQSRGLLP